MMDAMAKDPEGRRRRERNLALAGVLAFLVVLFYALTIVKFGAQG